MFIDKINSTSASKTAGGFLPRLGMEGEIIATLGYWDDIINLFLMMGWPLDDDPAILNLNRKRLYDKSFIPLRDLYEVRSCFMHRYAFTAYSIRYGR